MCLLATLGLGLSGASMADDGDLSFGAERRMGDLIAKQILRDPDYIDDPLLTEYVDNIWQRLISAVRSNGDMTAEMHERFAWWVMMGRDRSVNAFALPGGYFGVHLGLLGLVDSQDELASVLAHELTHVTQRHISRSIAKQGRQTPVLIAAMVLGALAAKRSPDAANAILAGSQAATIQSQLNYSRDMEREADRIGFNLMQTAGFAPQGFVAMFKQLQQSTRLSDNGSYPYLRSHPLTTERIGDMDARMQTSPSKAATKQTDSALEHALMSARARVLSDPGVDTLRLWAAEPQKASATSFVAMTPARQAGALYAAALASLKLRDFERAKIYTNRLKTLVAGDLWASRAINLLTIEIELTSENFAAALSLTDTLNASGQASRPELLLTARAQIAQNQAEAAAQKLRTWVASHPLDAPAWQLLANAYTALKQPLRSIRAEAEAQVALLDYAAAIDRFRAAQEWIRTNPNTGRDFIEESIIDVRTRQVQDLLKAQLQDEKDALK